jgi:acetyltransferase-like isoleucine patch superfamily enzyme
VIEPYRDDDGNEVVTTGRYEGVTVVFRGRNNRLVVADGARIDHLHVVFDCDNGTMTIGHGRHAKSGGRWGVRLGQDATVSIGNNVTCTGVCIVSAVEGVTVTIGDDVMLSSENQLRGDDGHPVFDVHTGTRVNPARSITLGNHVWLGLRAAVLAGGEVGEGSVIGFGSVVTGRIPNNCIAVGSPARVVRRDVAWERPHLSFTKPPYKPDASTVRRSGYWKPTVEGGTPGHRARRLAGRLRRRLRRHPR